MRVKKWTTRAIALTVAMLACAVVVAALGAAPASAKYWNVNGSLPTTSTWITDDWVASVAPGPGDTTLIAGGFSHVGPYTGATAKLTADASATAQDFPRVYGEVNSVISDGAGGYYLGGGFYSIDQTRIYSVAHVLADGTVDPDFTSPITGGTVYAMQLVGDDELWVGGYYDVADHSPANLRALDPKTGELKPYVFDTNNTVRSMLLDGTTLWVGGAFNEVNSESHTRLIRIDLTDHTLMDVPSVDAGWGYVNALKRVGDVLFIGGYFDGVAGASRRNLAAWNVDQESVESWNPSPGQPVNVFAVYGDRLYAGGGNGLFAFDITAPSDPQPLSMTWSPNSEIRSLSASDGKLYVGGWFDTWSSNSETEFRRYAAALDISGQTDSLLDWDPQPFSAPYWLYTEGDYVFLSGYFGSGRGYDHSKIAMLNAQGEALDWEFDSRPGWSCQQVAYDGQWIYAVGDFWDADESKTNYLLKIDPEDGAVVGAAQPDPEAWETKSLAELGDWLYFGTGNGAWRVAKSDLTNDEGFSCPTSGTVEVMVPTEDRLYIGGGFDKVSGEERTGVAAVDPETGDLQAWSPRLTATSEGSTYDPAVLCIQPTPDGVYLGGYFNTVGTPKVPQAYLARLDPVTAELDPHFTPYLSDVVYALTTNGRNVFAGGDFDMADETPVSGVVEFDPYGQVANAANGTPSPLGTASSMAIRGGQLYVGGSFWEAAVDTGDRETRQKRQGVDSWPVTAPPVAPSLLDFEASAGGPGEISLSWTEPTFLGYSEVRIFRSTTGAAMTPAGGVGQTKIYEGAGDSYIDTGRAEGVLYIYTAFPVDSEGTWGESAVTWFEIGGAGGLTPTAVTCSANHTTANYLEPVTVNGDFTADGVPTAGKTLELWGSTNTGGSWTKLATATDAGGGHYRATFKPRCNTYVEWRFADDSELQPCISTGVVLVKSRANLSRPYVDPDTPSAWDAFWVKGKLYPKHSFRTNVRIEVFKRAGGKWVWVKSPVYHVATGATSYKCRMVLGKGHYRIVAKHIDRNHDTTRSEPKYFDVKR